MSCDKCGKPTDASEYVAMKWTDKHGIERCNCDESQARIREIEADLAHDREQWNLAVKDRTDEVANTGGWQEIDISKDSFGDPTNVFLPVGDPKPVHRYTVTLTDREYDALKNSIRELEAKLGQWRQRGGIVGVIVRDENGKDWKWDGQDWTALAASEVEPT